MAIASTGLGAGCRLKARCPEPQRGSRVACVTSMVIRQPFDNRAVRPLVAMAALRKMPKRRSHVLQFPRFLFEKSGMLKGHALAHVRFTQ